jgi:O-antigen/teichoic acid export membrane protein
MLSRSLGPGGYGSYASLYAIIGPLGTLAAAGVSLSLMQHIVLDGEDVGVATRSCLSITLLIGSALTVVGLLIGNMVIEQLAVSAMVPGALCRSGG